MAEIRQPNSPGCGAVRQSLTLAPIAGRLFEDLFGDIVYISDPFPPTYVFYLYSTITQPNSRNQQFLIFSTILIPLRKMMLSFLLGLMATSVMGFPQAPEPTPACPPAPEDLLPCGNAFYVASQVSCC